MIADCFKNRIKHDITFFKDSQKGKQSINPFTPYKQSKYGKKHKEGKIN